MDGISCLTLDARKPLLHDPPHALVLRGPDGMVVDHPSRLHERVTHGGSDETETTFLQHFAHGLSDLSVKWYFFLSGPEIFLWAPTNKKTTESDSRTQTRAPLQDCSAHSL